MPEKFEKSMIFEYDDKTIPEFVGIETLCCPNCRYLYPVKPTYIDYSELYKREHELNVEMYKAFDNFCLQAANEVPEFKIYLHNNRVELINILKELMDALKNNNDFNQG